MCTKENECRVLDSLHDTKMILLQNESEYSGNPISKPLNTARADNTYVNVIEKTIQQLLQLLRAEER